MNESFAKRFFASGNAIGRHLRMSPRLPWLTIVGVAADVRNMGLEATPPSLVYRSFWPRVREEASLSSAYITVRSSLPQAAVSSAIRAVVRSIDSSLAVADVHPMGELVLQATATRRFQTALLALFSGVAVLLAVIGIYGLLAYSVRQRSVEIGIRIALGSSKTRVAALILREGFGLLGLSLLIGLAAALALTRLLSGFLYNVPILDPISFVVAPVLLSAAALMACLVPIYKASAVNPASALRRE